MTAARPVGTAGVPTAHRHLRHGDGVDARGRLAAVLGIAVAVLVVEVTGALLSGSLALLADAGHKLTDVAGLTFGLVAAVLSRRPATDAHTWGFRRAEVIGAAAQALVLLAVGVFVLVDGIRRLFSPPEVTSGMMLLFGAVGLVANIVGVAILSSGRRATLNLRAAFLEVLYDTLGSVAVLAAAATLALTGWQRADPIASLLIAALIIPRTLKLLHETVDMLMESTPSDVDLSAVLGRMLALPHVHDVHDLHVSQVTTGLPVLTAHVVVEDSCFHNGHLGTMLDELQDCLREDFGIEHTTIEFEVAEHVRREQLHRA